MMILITYDVNTQDAKGRRRLNRVAKTCKNYGQRVQNSVFECLVEPAQFVEVKAKLLDIIDNEADSLRFYFLGQNWHPRIEHFGIKPGYDPEGPLLV